MTETFILRQSSMQHTDGKRARREDAVDAIPNPDERNAPDAIGFTELDPETKRIVRARCKETGYRLRTAGAVGLAIHPKHTITEVMRADVLDSFRSPTGKGSYRARRICEVSIQTPRGNSVTLHETHWITDGGNRREGKRGHHSQLLVDQVRDNAKGSRVAFWLGDTNEDEGRKPEQEVQKPLTRGGLVSIYDALDRYPNTHGRKTIDVIGHFDKDDRVKPVDVSVGGPRNSDHRRVDATYRLLEVADVVVVEPPAPTSPTPAPAEEAGADLTITQRVVRNARRRGLTVLDHDDWNSQHQDIYALRRRLKPAKVQADTLVQHITVTLDTGPLTGDFIRDMQTVERIGMDRFGSGFSYNFGFDMATGMVGVGQPLDARGTHTVNYKHVPGFSYDQNYWARAFAVLGMERTPLSDAAEHAIAVMFAAMVDEGALTASPDYLPHSTFAFKDCPCDATRNRMPAIRRAALAQV